jgi:multidrug resistance protein
VPSNPANQGLLTLMRAPDPATPDVATPHPVLERPPYVILVAISAVGPLALNIFVPSMPGLQREFGVSYGVVQLTLTLYIIGMALCQLVYGPLSDRFGRRPVLLAGMALFVVASVWAVLATSMGMLIAARLLQAIGGASGLVLSRAIVRDLYDRDRSASVLGYITMAFVVAPMLAPTVGGLLDQFAGWRAIFVLLALVGALGARRHLAQASRDQPQPGAVDPDQPASPPATRACCASRAISPMP